MGVLSTTPKSRRVALVALVALPLLGATPVLAQRAGAAPTILQLPGGTRALGMGNTMVAGRTADVLFYNPAGVGVAEGLSIAAHRVGSASTLSTLSSASTIDGWGVGVGAQLLDSWARSSRLSAEAPQLARRGTLTATSRLAMLGVSKEYRYVRWGGAVKYVDQRLATVQSSTVALDAGASRDIGPVVVGLAAQNLGRGLRDGDDRVMLPRRYTLGASIDSLRIGAFVDVSATAAISLLHGGFVSPASGVEVNVTPLEGWTFAARAGARRVGHSTEQPLTLGAGLVFDRVSLDYAFHGMRGPGDAHRVGVQLR